MTPTQTDYIVLAYLAEGPRHGYRLVEQLEEDNVGSVLSFSTPSVYVSLRRLHRAGAVKLKIQKGRDRPDQKVYSITDKGRDLLGGLISNDAVFAQRVRFSSDLAFVLAEKLNLRKSQLRDAIERRIATLTTELTETQAAWRESETDRGGSDGISEIAFRHQIRFLKNEIDFYRKLRKELK